MLCFQIHNCWSFLNPYFISHWNNFAVNFNIFLGIDSMVMDTSCLAGNLLIQHVIFPVWKQFNTLRIFHQSSTITKLSIESFEINSENIRYFGIFFHHITICWIPHCSLDCNLSRIQDSYRFCNAVLDKKIRSYTE